MIKNSESCEFSQRWQGIRQGRRTRSLLCTYILWVNEQGEFFSGSKSSLISRFEWIISARSSCTSKLLRLLSKKTRHFGIELISEFPKEWVIITKILFCWVSYCFCLFGEFAKVFERQVRVGHLHSVARALSSPSRCFQLSTDLDKDLFGCFLNRDARTIFTNVERLFSFTYWNFTLRK